jgi:hypothetical protein
MDVQMKDYGARGPDDPVRDAAVNDTVMTDATDDAEPSSVAGSRTSPSENTWSNRKPLGPREIMLRPLDIKLPEPKEDEALFLPHDADRLWFLGYVQPWKDFNTHATKLWNRKDIRGAFDDLQTYPIRPYGPDSEITDDSHGSEILHSQFRCEVVDIMQNVYNKLMELSRLADGDFPEEFFQGLPDDEDIGNDEKVWKPSYIIKSSGNSEGETVRFLGQVEYLGGRKGALTWAIKESGRNSWGSLRCVLGKSFAYRAFDSADMKPRRRCPVHAHVHQQVRLRSLRRRDHVPLDRHRRESRLRPVRRPRPGRPIHRAAHVLLRPHQARGCLQRGRGYHFGQDGNIILDPLQYNRGIRVAGRDGERVELCGEDEAWRAVRAVFEASGPQGEAEGRPFLASMMWCRLDDHFRTYMALA